MFSLYDVLYMHGVALIIDSVRLHITRSDVSVYGKGAPNAFVCRAALREHLALRIAFSRALECDKTDREALYEFFGPLRCFGWETWPPPRTAACERLGQLLTRLLHLIAGTLVVIST